MVVNTQVVLWAVKLSTLHGITNHNTSTWSRIPNFY